MFITIDSYYDVKFYNEALEALKNNGVQFSEFISVKSPHRWFLKLDQPPIMVNFDVVKNPRWLVTKVLPSKINQEWLVFRRLDSLGKGIEKYILNPALQEATNSDFACFFNIQNMDQGKTLSKKTHSRIYYFGKYLGSRYKVCLCCDPNILLFLTSSQILLEKDSSELGRFEADFNYKVLLQKEFLKKYIDMPYFEQGNLIIPDFLKDQNISG